VQGLVGLKHFTLQSALLLAMFEKWSLRSEMGEFYVRGECWQSTSFPLNATRPKEVNGPSAQSVLHFDVHCAVRKHSHVLRGRGTSIRELLQTKQACPCRPFKGLACPYIRQHMTASITNIISASFSAGYFKTSIVKVTSSGRVRTTNLTGCGL
jgi:hypothetical protein